MKWVQKHREIIVGIISYLFILLFVYAAVSKLFDFENFKVQLGQSPMLTEFASWMAWAVPLLELVIAGMLLIPRLRLWGLYAAFTLMVMFTTYIFIILNYASYVPCSCGGVLEKLGWTEHLTFNLIFILLALTAIITAVHSSLNYPNLSKKMTFISLNTLAIVAISIVTLLYNSSEKNMHQRNPFIRSFTHYPIKLIAEKDLGLNSYYISGMDKSHIYLSNYTAPLRLMVLDHDLQVSQREELLITEDSVPYRSVRTSVIPPYFYLADGTIPYILKGRINEWQANYIQTKGYFSKATIIDSNTVAIRTNDAESGENILGVLLLGERDDPVIYLSDKLLKKQIDGVFDTDGIMVYNSQLNKIIYTYFYRNEYILTDRHLKALGSGKTIDTVSKAQIKISYVGSQKLRKMAVPPLIVNKAIATYGNYLYVHSGVMGLYELEDVWDSSSVIDVYDLRDQTYEFSFYIQDRGTNKLLEFMIRDDFLVCLIGNYLRVYKLDKAIFEIHNDSVLSD